MRREPRACGLDRSRFRLADFPQLVPALAGYSRSGLSRAMDRLDLTLQRGRLRLHSPDPAYLEKAAVIKDALTMARADADHHALYDGDEVSCYRHPSLAAVWAPAGAEPTAALSHRANTRHRVCGALDAASGCLVATTGSQITVPHLRRFLAALRAADPDRALTLVWDNWPVHAHPRVLAAAAEAEIALLWLPTYAPWLNPIEKLWRALKQEVLHHHRLADDWDGLKAAVQRFLDRCAVPSPRILRAVGLLPD